MLLTIDADLQDDINAIDEMVKSYMKEMRLFLELGKVGKQTLFLKNFS